MGLGGGGGHPLPTLVRPRVKTKLYGYLLLKISISNIVEKMLFLISLICSIKNILKYILILYLKREIL